MSLIFSNAVCRYLAVSDLYDEYVGKIMRDSAGKYLYVGDSNFSVSADQLREIADKLDEINERGAKQND
jgi:hypothetical protein